MTAKSTCKNWFTIIPKDVQEAEDFGSTRISEAPSAVAVQDKLKDQVKLWSTKWWMFALQVSTNNFTVSFPSRFRYRALRFPCHLFPNCQAVMSLAFRLWSRYAYSWGLLSIQNGHYLFLSPLYQFPVPVLLQWCITTIPLPLEKFHCIVWFLVALRKAAQGELVFNHRKSHRCN
jgi:hypothetical protein